MKKIFLLILLLNCYLLNPEVIIMKNDQVINGKIIKLDEDTLTIITKTEEMIIDKEDIKNIFYSESDYIKSLKTEEKEIKNTIVYEEKNFKADEELEKKYWQLFFNKKLTEKLKNYKYPDNCVILSIYAPIDGEDVIHIKGNKLWYEHKAYGLPGSVEGNRSTVKNPTIINGIKWYPKFNRNISDKFDLQIPLPEKKYFTYAKKINIKTKLAKIIQQPNKENNYTLSISLDDKAHGGDTFFKILIYYYLPEELTIY